MAANIQNYSPCKKKKTNTSGKNVDAHLPGKCDDDSASQSSTSLFPSVVNPTHPTATTLNNNLMQEQGRSLVPKRKQKDDEPSIATVCLTSGSTLTAENATTSAGLKNTLHGNAFQLKLLMLFLIRGIASNYQFHLGTEIPGMGGKFDDLIFKYSLMNNGEALGDKRSVRYRYLQAKHKQNEKSEKITAADLLNDNNGEFSLPKYFRSYYRDVIKLTEGILPESVHDCIICTNIGFDSEEKLKNSGIELISLDDEDTILTFEKVPNTRKTPTRYKLKKTEKLRRKMSEWSDMHLLAKTLLEYVTDNKKLAISSPIFKSYHFALIDEKVIDKEQRKLCATFLEGDSPFREILSEVTFVYYWEKLKLKYDDMKRIRVDRSKKLTDFDEKSLKKLLPKHSKSKPQTIELDFYIFVEYNDDLITENIIDSKGRKASKKSFTDNFIHGINLTREAFEFRGKLRNIAFVHYWNDLTIQLSEAFGRKITSGTPDENKSLNNLVGDKEINDFLDKLVFAVHTPNEVELDDILKKEVGDRYSLNESDFQSDFILRNMLDWFKEKESKFMTSEEGKNFFQEGKKKMKSLRVTAISIDYQKQLKEVLEFNEEAIEKMKEKLKQLLISPNRIGRIATPLPKRTAVKVIAALEKLRLEEPIIRNASILQEYYQRKDSYLVTSSSRLQKNRSKFKKTLKSEHSHNLLVVVCEDGPSTENEEAYQKLVKKMLNKRVIIISQDAAEIKDKLNFGDLSEIFKRALLEKEITFQGVFQSVGDLIKQSDMTLDDLIENGCAEEVIDSNSMEELLLKTGNISIRSCSSARFDPHLYIERQLEIFLDKDFYGQLAKSMRNTTDELQNECVVDWQGSIEWFVEDHRKEMIWKKMKNIVKENRQSSRYFQPSNGVVISEKNLINKENGKGRVFIISGLAGTGKSTILSNYYERIKNENPDTWVIKFDLMDYRKELSEFNFSRVHQCSAIEFFVNIFAKNSPFAQSLLTHRFQTDGRIVVMLDGFDEIDSKIHNKVFQLMTAIRLTKIDALYITTRSHLKEELQDKFFQFTYTFKNFSQQDQVNYLSKYWENKLEMPSVQNWSIQLLGVTLVTRLTATLKDKGKEFIGIPLQCQMLAECFETQLRDTIQQGLPIDSLIKCISKNDLDLTSLYTLFMKKKLEIYRREKFKAEPNNHQADWIIENTMRNLETYLRKLAIRTIVFYPKYVDVLLDQSSFQSKEEISQEEEDYTGDGVCFGFLDKNDKGEVKFLHRTYAEYLFAKYLHGGFLPEKDKNCNKLLTSEPVRKIIFRRILVEEPYVGVRVFFNSMLRECVLPIAHLSQEIEKSPRILCVAINDKNACIFKFMFDCLDMSFSKVDIRRILSYHAFDRDPIRGWFVSDTFRNNMFEQNSKVFERFISYYDEEAEQTEVQIIFKKMLHVPLQSLNHFNRNQKEVKKVMELVISFLDRNLKVFRMISGANFQEISYILKMFISTEFYRKLLQKYLELLSSIYSEDILFENVLVDAFKNHQSDISHENLKQILTTLRELGRNEVLKGISRQILKINTEIFKSFYQPKKEESTEGILLIQTNIQSLLVRDSYGLTRLHRAALHNDEEIVVRILEMVHICCLSPDIEIKKEGKEVLCNVIARDEEGFTPLYVAAVCERENICQKMLNFLKEMLPGDELCKYLSETNGFLCNALWDAIKWKKVQMFRIILKSVQKNLGQDYLFALMKAPIPEENILYRSLSFNMFCKCNIILFRIGVDVITGDETEGYKYLFDLLFQNKKFITILHMQLIYHTDNNIFQKMLSVNGLDVWVKRLLDIDIRDGFNIMLGKFLGKLTADQRSQLLRIIISVDYGTSYLDEWIDVEIFAKQDTNGYDSLKQILRHISNILGQSAIEELLVRDNYKIIRRAILDRGKNLVDVMLTFLSNNSKNKIIHNLVNMLHQQILEVTVNYDRSSNRCSIHNIINCVFDYVDNYDLSNLVDLISNNYIYNHSLERTHSIWSDYLDIKNKDHAKIVLENIDKFLKCVLDNLGQNAVEKLVVEHEGGQIIARFLTCTSFSKYFDDENLVDALVNAFLRHLSKEKRKEMERKLVKDAPAAIKSFIYKYPIRAEWYWTNILHLQYVVKHADSVELLELIEIITERYISNCYSEREISVWSNYLSNDVYAEHLMSENVDKFLQCVSEKLGKSKVKELVLHNHHVSVISRAAIKGEKRLVEAMLAHLTEEDHDEVRSFHVNTAVEIYEESLPLD